MSVVDLQQKLVPPDYRNLVINPSGETTYAASWFASNGVVTEGSTATIPLYGAGVIEYTVEQTTALSYFVSPFGPDGAVHHRAFEIPESRTVAARVSVRAPVEVWVQLQARYLTWTGTEFSEVHVTPLGAVVQVTNAGWSTVERFADTTEVPNGATHWQLNVAIVGSPAAVDIHNPGFETNTNYWWYFNGVGNGGTLTRDTTQFHSGTASGRFVADGTSPTQGIFLNNQAIFGVDDYEYTPALPSTTYTVTLWMRGNVGGEQVKVNLSSNIIFAETTTTLTTSWQKVVVSGITAPDATGFQLGIYGAVLWQAATYFIDDVTILGPASDASPAPAIGTKLWIDGAFVPDSGANLSGVTYVDGDQLDRYWEDEPNFSTSRTGAPPSQPDETPVTEIVPEDVADPVDTTDPPEETSEVHPEISDPQIKPDSPQEIQAFGATKSDAAKFVTTKTGNTTFSLSEDIQLSDLVLNRLDEDGVVWIVTDVEGWWTLPEPDVPDMAKGWDDGSYETRGRYQARVFTLNGIFFPRSRGLVPRARNRLIQAANLCHRGGYFMTHEADYTRGSKVYLSGAPQIATTAMSGRTEFSIGLRAPDPIKYGFNDRTPPGLYSSSIASRSVRMPGREYPREYSSVTGVWTYPEAVFGSTESVITNDGNTFTSPTFTLSGPTNGPVQIINTSTNQTMRINRQLYAGEQLVVNCFTKQVTLNRAPNQRFYLDVATDWIMLQPGGNRFYFLEEAATSNSAQLTITWRPGWIG